MGRCDIPAAWGGIMTCHVLPSCTALGVNTTGTNNLEIYIKQKYYKGRWQFFCRQFYYNHKRCGLSKYVWVYAD